MRAFEISDVADVDSFNCALDAEWNCECDDSSHTRHTHAISSATARITSETVTARGRLAAQRSSSVRLLINFHRNGYDHACTVSILMLQSAKVNRMPHKARIE